MPVLSRVEGSVKTRCRGGCLATISRFSSYRASPLREAGLLKVQAHFRQRRISLRLSRRDRRGLLLGHCPR